MAMLFNCSGCLRLRESWCRNLFTPLELRCRFQGMYRNKLEVSSLQINMFKYFLILFFLVHYVESNFTANFDKKEVTVSYLDIAFEMIEKAKSNIPTCSDAEKSPMDCADILRMGQGNSGVYTIWPMNRLTEDKPLDVYCDMETDGGGWTLMYRRGNYGRPNDYFFKEWKSYKEGFGDIQKDFWFHRFVLLYLLVNYVESNFSSNCDKKEVAVLYLNVAVEMIERAKSSIPTRSGANWNPVDCADILHTGQTKSGVYTIWPNNRLTEGRPLDVYCDMDTDGGGWTVIQRRGNYGSPHDFFYNGWKVYKEGFGDIHKDFWLGNDNIFALTNQMNYSVRFDLQDKARVKKYALYDYFWIDDEFNNYTLHIAKYSGDAGDSMIGHHNNRKFSTKDVDNDYTDNAHCAQRHKGGWWFNNCHRSNLNGLYFKDDDYAKGVIWYNFKGYNESLNSTEIKIRPKKFVVQKLFHQSSILGRL